MAHFSWFFRIKIELHFSLIAAAVTYIMWKNVGNDKIQKMEGKKFPKEVDQIDSKKRRYWRVDCQSASKGLFLGKVTLEIKKICRIDATRSMSQFVTPHVTNWIWTQIVTWALKNKNCPNELKFCEDSRNLKSIRWWKFHLSVFKRKKCFPPLENSRL